jgi:predicted GTPase
MTATAPAVRTERPRRRAVILGAGGRDFHVFATAFRDDPSVEVVAFTATQIPGIAHRVFPASLAGPRYPHGIPIEDERDLPGLLAREQVDEVVLAYSDLRHVDVMHTASLVLASGADFRLVGPKASSLRAAVPVVAVCASRTGAGKSQTSRFVCRRLQAAGLRVALVRHPMPYGDLEAMRVQRFASLADIDASNPTVEEREEYEAPVALGIVVWAGVDYEAIVAAAADESDVIVWDGGNNDFPFVVPDLMITVVDPLRPGDERNYHPGETCVRMADVVVVNKVDSATAEAVAEVRASVAAVNPRATLVEAASPPVLDDGPPITGRRVVVVEDGPTLTHGGMAFGAATVAARAAGAVIVDPRPGASGAIADAYRRHPHLGEALPALGYDPGQLRDLAATVTAARCDAVVAATPVALARLIDVPVPIRQVRYELEERPAGPLATLIDRFAAGVPVGHPGR